jgi:hypothetical protein
MKNDISIDVQMSQVSTLTTFGRFSDSPKIDIIIVNDSSKQILIKKIFVVTRILFFFKKEKLIFNVNKKINPKESVTKSISNDNLIKKPLRFKVTTNYESYKSEEYKP